MYKKVLESAMDNHEAYEKMSSMKYYYWEIGLANSIGIGPIRD